jgi:hypothetical protein
MNWTIIGIGFALSVLMGAGLMALLATIRPQWSIRRRQLTAASILPAITAVMTLMGIIIVWTSNQSQDKRMVDLAIGALATIGGGFTLMALVGGFIGAAVAGKGQRR